MNTHELAANLRLHARKIGTPAGDTPSVMSMAADRLVATARELAALKAPPAPGDVRAGLAGYAEWCGSPPVLTDAVDLIDQQAQRIAQLAEDRDALHNELNEWRFTNGVDVMRRELDHLRARLAEIEAQEPVAWMRAIDAEWLAVRGYMTVSGERDGGWRSPLYARPVPVQAVPDGWRLVPTEPTLEMARAGHYRYCTEFVKDYKLMIAAAPEAAR